ncbi:hypothetical protein PHMEG_0009454 [Phytophthora megakarya]|uniref:Uncharacterized protein n=1 Tax=Phytophthora megakarya TaxID=4795 RepID=A0A225WG66_9STRA|nr:hypothetical protein PHMEG_0009454 [Phytophthora megakarya]
MQRFKRTLKASHNETGLGLSRCELAHAWVPSTPSNSDESDNNYDLSNGNDVNDNGNDSGNDDNNDLDD